MYSSKYNGEPLKAKQQKGRIRGGGKRVYLVFFYYVYGWTGSVYQILGFALDLNLGIEAFFGA